MWCGCGLGEVQDKKEKDVYRRVGISPSDVRFFRRLFGKIDYDRSGTISVAELLVYLKLPTTDFNKRVFYTIDKDRSDEIDVMEFTLGCWNYCTLDHKSLVHFAFALYDSGQKNYLRVTQLEKVFEECYGSSYKTRPEVYKTLKMIIEDFHAKISPFEFEAIANQYPMMLLPAFTLQNELREGTGGRRFWARLTKRRHLDHRDKVYKLGDLVGMARGAWLEHEKETGLAHNTNFAPLFDTKREGPLTAVKEVSSVAAIAEGRRDSTKTTDRRKSVDNVTYAISTPEKGLRSSKTSDMFKERRRSSLDAEHPVVKAAHPQENRRKQGRSASVQVRTKQVEDPDTMQLKSKKRASMYDRRRSTNVSTKASPNAILDAVGGTKAEGGKSPSRKNRESIGTIRTSFDGKDPPPSRPNERRKSVNSIPSGIKKDEEVKEMQESPKEKKAKPKDKRESMTHTPHVNKGRRESLSRINQDTHLHNRRDSADNKRRNSQENQLAMTMESNRRRLSIESGTERAQIVPKYKPSDTDTVDIKKPTRKSRRNSSVALSPSPT